MSSEDTTSTTLTSEVQKESLQSSTEGSAVEAEGYSEYATAESSCYATAEDTSDEACVGTRPQSSLQHGVATGSTKNQDSQESSSSRGGGSTKMSEGDANNSVYITESQQGGAETGPVGGAETGPVVTGRKKCVESLQVMTKYAIPTVTKRVYTRSRDSATGSSSTGDSQETAIIRDSSRRVSLESGVAGDISNSVDLQDYIAANGYSIERLLRAVVRDSNGQVSLESGAVGDVSNSPESQVNPVHSAASWGMVHPAYFVSGPVSSEQVPTRDGRDQAIDDLMSGYNQCFNICACMCDYLRPLSRRIQKSKIFVGIRICLAIISIIAFVMGFISLSHCPLKHELPILIMLLGIAGIFLLSISWCKSSFCPNFNRWYFTAGIIIARLIFLGLFAVVLNATYSISPSFDHDDLENYCNREFYYFAYYTNFIIAGVVVLAFLIYAPSVNESASGYEEI